MMTDVSHGFSQCIITTNLEYPTLREDFISFLSYYGKIIENVTSSHNPLTYSQFSSNEFNERIF